MAQKREKSDNNAMVPAGTTGPSDAAVAPVAPKAASGDPDAVLASPDVGGMTVDIRQRDAQRGATAALRSEIRAVVQAQRLAAAVADKLCSYAEIAELPAKILNVKIEARRRGDLPLIGAK